MRRLGVAIATVGGLGYFPIAPGTVGSAAGLAIYALSRRWSLSAQLLLLLSVIIVGTWAASQAAHHFGQEDPGPVVVDEVAGQLVTLFGLAVGVAGAVTGFLLFRVLDIVKPFPARQFERLPGGVGVMADDVMAGVYGWIILRAVLWAVTLVG